jgi:excisionase family DNA binding protein
MSKVQARHRPAQKGRLLTVKQAAERLGTTERYPYRLIAERRIGHVKLGNSPKSPVRIPEEALEAFIRAGTVEPAE